VLRAGAPVRRACTPAPAGAVGLPRPGDR